MCHANHWAFCKSPGTTPSFGWDWHFLSINICCTFSILSLRIILWQTYISFLIMTLLICSVPVPQYWQHLGQSRVKKRPSHAQYSILWNTKRQNLRLLHNSKVAGQCKLHHSPPAIRVHRAMPLVTTGFIGYPLYWLLGIQPCCSTVLVHGKQPNDHMHCAWVMVREESRLQAR